jgi:hypothetical protein
MEGMEKLIWGWALQRALATGHADRLKPSSISRRWPELSTAVRESRWDDEALVRASLRAFIQGVIDGDLPAPATDGRRRRPGRARRVVGATGSLPRLQPTRARQQR